MHTFVSKLFILALFLSVAALAGCAGDAVGPEPDARAADVVLNTTVDMRAPPMKPQSGPPPPVISGSIVNGSPFLEWDHVTQAEDYIVYRIDTYTGTTDSWVTVINEVHDKTRYPVAFQTQFFNTITYYVVSRDPYLNTGGQSNKVRYQYDW